MEKIKTVEEMEVVDAELVSDVVGVDCRPIVSHLVLDSTIRPVSLTSRDDAVFVRLSLSLSDVAERDEARDDSVTDSIGLAIPVCCAVSVAPIVVERGAEMELVEKNEPKSLAGSIMSTQSRSSRIRPVVSCMRRIRHLPIPFHISHRKR